MVAGTLAELTTDGKATDKVDGIAVATSSSTNQLLVVVTVSEIVYVAVTVGAVTKIMDVTVEATGMTEMVVVTVDGEHELKTQRQPNGGAAGRRDCR
jgi:hypothetical protein